ncbi:PepSY domain-containing protein [Ligilactobacillus sp. Marseille-Q7487]|jgi:uncharacterized membrane protein YkoI|uniref:PepSY domain-containing protein n=1 Tax=Ligilactobacillus sp. Marseille-Q7487 TaxID=3022128 RepID=UPI0015B702C5|nr:PepSY domain-containing protein [Ligilactobacillus sp. Marseille-Q7487]
MKKVKLLGVGVLAALVLAGCSNNQPTTQHSQATSSSQSHMNSQTTTTTSGVPAEIKVSVADAIAFYQEKHPNTDITSLELELDKSLGNYVYKIDGMDDNTEYELKFDAETKNVYHDRSEMLDHDEQNGVERANEKLDLSNILDLQAATQAAQKEAGSGTIESWELDRNLGTTYWEVKFRVNNQEVNVKLNAQNGTILEKEVDD